eukprot:CAMPEP_0172309638 /NCGR_PEP_ID=MMETSP1058-20130122/10307_1 /TAXON_ID=83371 /ORGANISM="Detonula confervacea, Strain CCMP 353" /LENGTH=345 /DNA_ID=CAMNT_0013022297 /DNA_START=120 /DNA_END=1157 /DNA_ORIENTATION=+
MTSTKKQKMMISRSIVDKVRTELNPPGRFLEKDPMTGLWHEVDDKRALLKTAQVLRDGAAALRKQLTEDMSDPNFLNTLFDVSGTDSAKSSDQPIPKFSSGKKHCRTLSDSASDRLHLKRERSDSDVADCVSDPTGMDKTFMAEIRTHHPMFASQQQSVQAQSWSHQQPMLSSMVPSAILFRGNNHARPKKSRSNPDILGSVPGIQQSRLQQQHWQAPLPPHAESPTSTSLVGIFKAVEPFSHLPRPPADHKSMNALLTKAHFPSMATMDDFSTQNVSMSGSLTPHTTDCDEKNTNATAAVLANVKHTIDEEEFAREMGPDEHFIGICYSRTGNDFGVFDVFDDD